MRYQTAPCPDVPLPTIVGDGMSGTGAGQQECHQPATLPSDCMALYYTMRAVMPWRSTIPPDPRTAAPCVRRLLQCRGSLFQELKRHCPGAMHIDILGLHCTHPTREESAALGLDSGRRAWIREILLCCGEKNWVYARTVIPLASLVGSNRVLYTLRRRSLGDILFRAARARRKWLQYQSVSTTGLPSAAMLPAGEQNRRLWARRSLFELREKPLLLTEYFLSSLE